MLISDEIAFQSRSGEIPYTTLTGVFHYFVYLEGKT